MNENYSPQPGIDYARTFQEFDAWFAKESSCREYLLRVRWSDGFQCARCGAKSEPWVTARGYLHCRQCGREVSVTAGTLFEGTRKPLRVWFFAMWFVLSQKHGASALGLKRVLDLGSYQTAWAWLHKMRRAMVRPGRDLLTGAVEVDETFIGAPEENVHGRETDDKAIVVVAAERRGRAIGRIRLRRIMDASAGQLTPFIEDFVKYGAVIMTDGWRSYAGLESLGYQHEVNNITKSGEPAHKLLPKVHRVASLLKRWLLGTLQGGVQSSHPFIERVIGTCRREFLDHLLFWNEQDLQRKLVSFQHYYNEHRAHMALENPTPIQKVSESTPNNHVLYLKGYQWKSHCGGLFKLPTAA